jgi:hypothetical protein
VVFALVRDALPLTFLLKDLCFHSGGYEELHFVGYNAVKNTLKQAAKHSLA